MSENLQPEITEIDLKEASDAMTAGYSNCGLMRHFQPGHSGKPCDCDHGAINGCKARLNAIAEAIAAARNSELSNPLPVYNIPQID